MSLSVKHFFKSVNIWQSYKQERAPGQWPPPCQKTKTQYVQNTLQSSFVGPFYVLGPKHLPTMPKP